MDNVQIEILQDKVLKTRVLQKFHLVLESPYNYISAPGIKKISTKLASFTKAKEFRLRISGEHSKAIDTCMNNISIGLAQMPIMEVLKLEFSGEHSYVTDKGLLFLV